MLLGGVYKSFNVALTGWLHRRMGTGPQAAVDLINARIHFDPEAFNPLQRFRSPFAERFHKLRIRAVVAGGQGLLGVPFRAVVLADLLGLFGIRSVEAAAADERVSAGEPRFFKHEHLGFAFRSGHGGGESGAACAHHNDVRFRVPFLRRFDCVGQTDTGRKAEGHGGFNERAAIELEHGVSPLKLCAFIVGRSANRPHRLFDYVKHEEAFSPKRRLSPGKRMRAISYNKKFS